MSDRSLVGACGIYCGACMIYRAYKDNDERLTQYLTENGLSRDKIHCEGCVSGDVSVTCVTCSYRDCAKQKGITFCFECKDMPCEKIVELVEKRSRSNNLPHLTLCLTNLQTLKQTGIQEWLRKQEGRWKCAKCGRRMNWYSELCPDCGTEFLDAVKEARSLGKLRGWPSTTAPK